MMKMTKKKKIIFGTLALALVCAVTAVTLMAGFTTDGTESTAMQVRTTALEKGDLAISVNATGTVYSAKSTSVYSNMSYPVKTVLVGVGDKVAVGDTLCELDTAELESSIAEKQASLAAAQVKAGFSVQKAEDSMENDPEDVRIEYDKAIENAQMSIETAENNLQSQRHTVDEIRDEIRALRNDELQVADDSTYEETISAKQSELVKAEISLENAMLSVEEAEANLQAQLEEKDRKIAQAEKDAADNLTDAQLNANLSDQQIAIEQLQKDLANAAVISGVSGTVTEVYAVEGGSGNGLLFVIQDTDNLKIVANIKEYDMASVSVGNRVVITTDATGDTEISGTLSKIAPTSTLTSAGDTSVSSTEAEYQSEIAVSSSGSGEGLKVGMNAQVSIITEERKDVFTVLYDAVVNTPEGTFVYIMSPEGAGESGGQGTSGAPENLESLGKPGAPEGLEIPEGADTANRPDMPDASMTQDSRRDLGENREMPGFTAKAVAVTTGIENDLYIEVSGEGLAEGMMVISDATGITEGMSVTPRVSGAAGNAEGDAPAGDGGFGMPGMGGGPRMGG
jgi:multidrug efflux pump subunit AcrA (membrane-fusion protein)